MGEAGPVFITAAMILFAFTTLLGNLYYVDRCLFYMLGKEPGRKLKNASHIIASIIIFAGSVLSADLLWNIADITMGGMTLVNMPVIIYLSKYVFRTLKDYDKKRKMGIEPTFRACDIDLPHKTDYWN